MEDIMAFIEVHLYFEWNKKRLEKVRGTKKNQQGWFNMV